jgi:hypothetical protein
VEVAAAPDPAPPAPPRAPEARAGPGDIFPSCVTIVVAPCRALAHYLFTMTNTNKTRKTETFTIANICGGDARTFRWTPDGGVPASAFRHYARQPMGAVVAGPAAEVALAELADDRHFVSVVEEATGAAAKLEVEAGQAGDLEQVAQCRKALAGDAPALADIYATHCAD